MSDNKGTISEASRRWFDLIVDVRAGAPADDLIRDVWPFWYAIGLRVLGDADEAADAAQNASLRLFLSLDKFDLSRPEATRAWVASLGRNCAIDVQRKRRKQMLNLEQAEGQAGGEDPADAAARRETAERLREALAKLPPELAEVADLRVLRGLTLGEIGAKTGQSITGVHHRVGRALNRLRDHVKPE